MTAYEKRDARIPLILSKSEFEGDIYNPVMAVVNYISGLYRAGYTPETIHPDYADFYLLDFYSAQVRNGGHSQYIHNCHEHLHYNLERAISGAKKIGTLELATVIENCAAWCKGHPDEAARQTGFDVRASALDKLDSDFYSHEFSDQELETLLKNLPSDLRLDLKERLFVPENAEELTEKYVSEALRQAEKSTPERGAAAALPLLEPLFEWNALNSSKYGVDSRKDSIVRRLNHFGVGQADELAANLRKRVVRDFASLSRYDRSRYYLTAYVWLRTHPNLLLIQRDDKPSKIDEIVRQSPFTDSEMKARELDALHELVPKENHLVLAFLLGKVLIDTQGHRKISFLYSDAKNDENRELHALETCGQKFFLEKKKGRTRLRRYLANWFAYPMFIVAFIFNLTGVISEEKFRRWFGKLPFLWPGAVLVETASDMGLNAFLKTMYIPEIIGLGWPETELERKQKREVDFQRVLILELDRTVPKLVLFVDTEKGDVTITADNENAEITRLGETKTFSIAELAEYRNQKQREQPSTMG